MESLIDIRNVKVTIMFPDLKVLKSPRAMSDYCKLH